MRLRTPLLAGCRSVRLQITGTDEEIAETLASFRGEGADEVLLRLFPNDHSTTERFGRILERIGSSAR